MTTTIKLTDTQANILNAAADRPDGNIDPLPVNQRANLTTLQRPILTRALR